MDPINDQLTSSALCLDNHRLELILFATEQCNFRCIYCWETPGHGTMPPEVVEGINQLLARRSPDLRELTISWFGGEPLLARKVVRKVMGRVGQLHRQNPSMQISSNMTTNAWHLDSAVLKELVELGIDRYQVTIDGPKQWHDRRRLLASGSGTYDRIWANLRSLRDTGLEFTLDLRIHVDRENAPDIPRFFDQCANEFGGDPRFKIFLYPLSRLGSARDSELQTLSCEQDRSLFLELQELASSLGFEATTPLDSPTVCHTAQTGSWIIRADGRMGKCPVGLDHPANRLGKINPDGSLDIDNNLFLPWMRGVASGDEEELACPLKGIPGPPADEEEARQRSEEFLRNLERRLSILSEEADISSGTV